MPSPSLTPQEFAAKWRGDTRKERSVAQEHFIDLCRMLGHETPGDNRDGSLAFEAGVDKQKGGQGWADVWKQGAFAWEYKGPHSDLAKTYQQIQQYRESLQNPPLLVVCDIQQIVIHTNFTNTVKQVFTITLDALLTPAGQKQLRDVFYAPESFRAPQTTEQVTKQAAEEFSELAKLLRRYGEDPQRTAHFLIRLLFCLFAEDIGLLPNGLFSRLITTTRKRAPLFAEQLRQLFAAMATGGFFAMEDIPYFNGHLFDDADVLELDSDGLDILARVSALDWSSIEPAILGTLFERSLDPSKRSQLGAHYTSRDDILLIVEPVLMAPLRRRWEAVQAQARDLAAQRDALPDSLDRAIQRRRANLTGEISALLVQFDTELSSIRVLDPACGSGNFLYVALKQLLDLEKAVITFAGDLGAGSFFPNVSPEQLRGIEINDYAYELAQITVWIGYIQWLADNGYGRPSQPILKPLDTIKHMDAILAYDADGKPVEPEWPEADVIVGNPPFLGGSKLRRELGHEYADNLWSLFDKRLPATSDLVCYWFECSRNLVAQKKVKRAGLLATNSIRQPHSRPVLSGIKETGDIFMAWSDRQWVLDGAAVRVSMIGFDNGDEVYRELDGGIVTTINSDLTGAIDLTKARQLIENYNIGFVGSEKGGDFELTSELAEQMLNAKGNPNNRPNSDVIHPWINGLDITRRNRHLWIIDFGVGLSEEDAALYEMPFEYIKRHVYPERSQNRRLIHARRWWQHREASHAMRIAIQGLERYPVTPRVAKHRFFVWIEPPTLPDNNLAVMARTDDYFFGVLHSKLHELWSLRLGTRMGVGNDPRYTPTTTFETYPFPWPPGAEPADDPRVAAIGAAARELVEKRDRWLNPPVDERPTTNDESGTAQPSSSVIRPSSLKERTLTNLYNQRPTWLDLAHKKLDRAVLDSYGWPHDIADDEILARLLALNLERAAGQAGAAAHASADDADDQEA